MPLSSGNMRDRLVGRRSPRRVTSGIAMCGSVWFGLETAKAQPWGVTKCRGRPTLNPLPPSRKPSPKRNCRTQASKPFLQEDAVEVRGIFREDLKKLES